MAPLELRFRPTGVGRWLEAAFLTVWLTGWAVAELLVLGLLARGIGSLLQGRSLHGQPASLVALLPVGGFLLVWLGLWSLGGVLALQQWLRCFWAEDQLTLTVTHLEIRRGLGPWQGRRRLPRETIQAVRLPRRGSRQARALIAQVGDHQVELTRLGSLAERERAADLLQRALAVEATTAAQAATPQASLPGAWECEQPSFDTALLVPARHIRRVQALVMLPLALALDAGVLLLLDQLRGRLERLPVLLMLGVFAAAASWGAIWLALGRQEWRLGSGELVAQRRFAGRVRELFAARGLELREASDEDGDLWFSLVATQLQPLAGSQRPGKGASVLCRTLNDPGAPRALGQWLAQRTRIPFDDSVPSEEERQASHKAHLEQLRRQLQTRGRAGRWLAARLRQLE